MVTHALIEGTELPETVMATPTILRGESSSPKSQAEIEI